jgi:DNA-binding response OmpR family regulator
MDETTLATTPVTAAKIVIVEDNAALADIYKTRLELLGHTVFIGYNGITGLYFIQSEQPDLVLLDLMIPDIAGDQVLRTMRGSEWGRDIPTIIISNLNESEAAPGLRQLGIEDYVIKANMQDDTLDQLVTAALAKQAQPAVSNPAPNDPPLNEITQSVPVAEAPTDTSQ